MLAHHDPVRLTAETFEFKSNGSKKTEFEVDKPFGVRLKLTEKTSLVPEAGVFVQMVIFGCNELLIEVFDVGGQEILKPGKYLVPHHDGEELAKKDVDDVSPCYWFANPETGNAVAPYIE